ncbi:TlpA disulfide reductase family protein [Chitinophaga alhagiae]|uniref:TlpA disulfide reductase family protein n=1 Tax=Chitinophaga alhagiae TaxID=2203219 RepID=UPI000E5BF9FE|nr:TlpA disulfide reductase family protein [Chitinophaga alhagiae]
MKHFAIVLFAILIQLTGHNLLAISDTPQKDSLKVGSMAPPLEVGKWIKGEAVNGFNPEYYYIVEFSGVACAPCRASIPHLSEMAQTYRSILKVASIYVLENGAYPPKDTNNTSYVQRVERFIHNMGDKIRYEVAVDNPKQSIFRDWVLAAGRYGIPVAFIVDRTGRINWIGHPDHIEKQLLSIDPVFTRLAAASGHAVQASSDTISPLKKFKMLLRENEQEAYLFAKQMSVGPLKDSEPILYYMTREIISQSAALKQPDFDLAISLIERAVFLCIDDIVKSRMMSLKADIFQRMGNRQAAKMTLLNARSQLELFQKEIKYKNEIDKIDRKLERFAN